MKSKSTKFSSLNKLNLKGLLSKGSFDKRTKRVFFGRNPFKISMKANSILAIVLVVIMLVSVFAWLSTETQRRPSVIQLISSGTSASPSPTNNQTSTPTGTRTPNTPDNNPWNPVAIVTSIIDPTPGPLGLIESNSNADKTMWTSVAANAWNYFQPGIGVDSTTGLPGGSLGWPYFTDWDLGVYIQAVIDAQKIGLIGKDGDWGSSARLEKVVRFLETRELNSTTNVPFWFYAANGEGYITQYSVDIVDTGTLFVALNNLKIYDSNFTSRIDNFVYNRFNNRTDYAVLVPEIKGESVSNSIYAYYYASGFAFFWPNELASLPNTIIDNIHNAQTITTYNVTLPKAQISCEPLLYSFFYLDNNPKIVKLMNDTYSAHEAKYNATGQYVAFSEGLSYSSNFIWEWVVTPSGDTWIVTNGQTYININPVIYNKVSLSFLALYNTTFARDMNIYLERILPNPTNGYSAGAEYNENRNNANLVASVDSNTNGLIISAARYAIKNNS